MVRSFDGSLHSAHGASYIFAVRRGQSRRFVVRRSRAQHGQSCRNGKDELPTAQTVIRWVASLVSRAGGRHVSANACSRCRVTACASYPAPR